MVNGSHLVTAAPQMLMRASEARTIEEKFDEIHRKVDQGALSTEELVTWFHEAGLIGREAWVLQAHILAAAKERSDGKPDGSLRTLAAAFGISQSNASVYIKIWKTFGRNFATTKEEEAYARLIGVSWYRTAAYAEDPDAALT